MKRLFLFLAPLLLCACTGIELFVANVPTWFSPENRVKGLSYGSQVEQRLDVYLPPERTPTGRPVIVFFHGGSWASGSIGQYRFVGHALAEQGYVAVVPAYRLYPDVRYPAFLEDAALAIAWTVQHAAEYGGDTDRVFLMGHSAGAYIAVQTALDRHYLDQAGVSFAHVRGIIGLSGPYDFLPLDSDLLRGVFESAVNLETTQPIHYARGDAPPLLLIQGGADTVVAPRNAEHLANVIRERGGAVELKLYPGVGHGDTIGALTTIRRERAPVLQNIVEFVTEHDKPKSADQGPGERGSPAAAAGTLTLGATLPVNRLGFGAMRLTGPGIWGEPKDRQGAGRVLRRALELGINFVDTADSYGPEANERIIADFLHPYPAGLVIATKAGLVRPGPDRWEPDGRPEHLRAACEASLKRLRLQAIDVYQLHTPDRRVPLEDSIGALARLQSEGKVRNIGVSNVSLDELRCAQRLAKIVSVQNRYNLGDRASDDVLEYCEQQGIAFIPWFPLASGQLAAGGGRSRAGSVVRDIARARGYAPSQLALAWLLARSPVMLPIPGTSSVIHLEENVAAAAIRLSLEDRAKLDRLAA